MGASQSSPKEAPADKSFFPPSQAGSVSFSPELLSQLANEQTSSAPSPARQSSLDESIRAKLQSSLSSLQADKEALTKQFHASLAPPPSGSSKSAADDDNAKSSHTVARGIEEIKEKIERFERKKKLDDWPEVDAKKESVTACYKRNPDTPLNCWREAEEFKAAVAKLEQHFVSTLRA